MYNYNPTDKPLQELKTGRCVGFDLGCMPRLKDTVLHGHLGPDDETKIVYTFYCVREAAIRGDKRR